MTDGALQVFTVKGVIMLVEGDLVAQHQTDDQADDDQMRADQPKRPFITLFATEEIPGKSVSSRKRMEMAKSTVAMV